MARLSAEERRRLLVDAAIRVMTRDGVAQATTRAIVSEADMSLGAFHYCFRSKEELLENVIVAITERTALPAQEILEGPGDVEERLRASLMSYWQHVLDHPAEHQLTYELTQYATRTPGLADLARTQYRNYLKTNTRLMEALRANADVAWTVPTEALVRYLTAVIDGLTLLFLNERDAEAATAAIDLAALQLLNLLAQPA